MLIKPQTQVKAHQSHKVDIPKRQSAYKLGMLYRTLSRMHWAAFRIISKFAETSATFSASLYFVEMKREEPRGG